MSWEIEYTDEFEEWWNKQTEDAQEAITQKVKTLSDIGPNLGRPHVDTLYDSRHSNMKELRVRSPGEIRVFFAFDPRRMAILLVAADKEGKDEKLFYQKMITQADELYDQHLKEIEDE